MLIANWLYTKVGQEEWFWQLWWHRRVIQSMIMLTVKPRWRVPKRGEPVDPFPFWLKIDADCGLPGLAFRSRDMLAQRRYLVARSPGLPISLRVAGLSLSGKWPSYRKDILSHRKSLPPHLPADAAPPFTKFISGYGILRCARLQISFQQASESSISEPSYSL